MRSARYAAKNVSWTPHPLMAPQAWARWTTRAGRGGGWRRRARQCSRSWAVAAARRRAGAPVARPEDGPQPVAEAGEARCGGRRRRRGLVLDPGQLLLRRAPTPRRRAPSRPRPRRRARPPCPVAGRRRGAGRPGPPGARPQPRRELHEARGAATRRRAGRRGGPPSWRRRSGTTWRGGVGSPVTPPLRPHRGEDACGLWRCGRARWAQPRALGPPAYAMAALRADRGSSARPFELTSFIGFGHTKPSMEKCGS